MNNLRDISTIEDVEKTFIHSKNLLSPAYLNEILELPTIHPHALHRLRGSYPQHSPSTPHALHTHKRLG